MPGEVFARLHKLTGGELRVLLALAQGLSAREAAVMLGISEPTVRTHVQHMFAKTYTLRQADLLRLLQNSTPAVRAPPTLNGCARKRMHGVFERIAALGDFR